MQQRHDDNRLAMRAVALSGWRAWLALAVGATVIVALMLVFSLLFVVLLPVFLVLGLVARWWLGRELRRAGAPAADRPPLIEGTYDVVEPPPGRGWGPRRRS
jgi:uncharacterized membrane protein